MGRRAQGIAGLHRAPGGMGPVGCPPREAGWAARLPQGAQVRGCTRWCRLPAEPRSQQPNKEARTKSAVPEPGTRAGGSARHRDKTTPSSRAPTRPRGTPAPARTHRHRASRCRRRRRPVPAPRRRRRREPPPAPRSTAQQSAPPPAGLSRRVPPRAEWFAPRRLGSRERGRRRRAGIGGVGLGGGDREKRAERAIGRGLAAAGWVAPQQQGLSGTA